jgi:hypothetical protein
MNLLQVFTILNNFVQEQKKKTSSYAFELVSTVDLTKDDIKGEIEKVIKLNFFGARSLERNKWVCSDIPAMCQVLHIIGTHLKLKFKFSTEKMENEEICGFEDSSHTVILTYKYDKLYYYKVFSNIKRKHVDSDKKMHGCEIKKPKKTNDEADRKLHDNEVKKQKKIEVRLSDSESEEEPGPSNLFPDDLCSIEQLTDALSNVDSSLFEDEEKEDDFHDIKTQILAMMMNMLNWLKRIENIHTKPTKECKLCAVHCLPKLTNKSHLKGPSGRGISHGKSSKSK